VKKGVTIKDIAKKLNMSVSTVSKALSNHANISNLTKERVHRLAREWNYVPNEAARHFKQNKSFTLGVVIPDLIDQFFVAAIRGVEEIAGKHKYQVIIAQSHEDAEKEEQIIKNLISNRVDGVIITISKNTNKTELFTQLEQNGIPVVFLTRSFGQPLFNNVTADNIYAGELATNYLYQLGHRRIAHLMGPKTLSTSHQRLEGYIKGLEKLKIGFDPGLLREVDFSEEQTHQAIKELLKIKNPPTAFFVFKTYVSLDAINYIKINHPKLLQKIDIIGFGNLPLIKYLDIKPKASLEENSYEMGLQSATLLMKLINNPADPGPPVSIKIPCELIIH
jgi:LacI family transcriptional regulator